MAGRSFKTTVIVLGGILITVVIAISLFALINGYSTRYMISKLFPGTVENIYKPYKIVEEKISAAAKVTGCNGYVYILDGKNITIFDSRGTEQYADILSFEDPGISGGSDRVIVFDKPTGNYIVFKDGDLLYTDTIGKTILGTGMQDNGYIVFILKGKDGFLGSAVVISDNNKLIAGYDYADRFPVSGCVIGKSGTMVVAGIYEDDTSKTGVDIYREYKSVPIAGFTKDNIMPLMRSIGDKSFVLAGSNAVTFYSHEGSELAKYSFNEIIRICVSSDGCWIADRKTGSDSITGIDENGDKKWKYSTGVMTDGISVGERHIFYWAGINSECLDKKGRPVEMQSGYEPVRGIVDMGNGKIVTITAGGLIFYEYH